MSFSIHMTLAFLENSVNCNYVQVEARLGRHQEEELPTRCSYGSELFLLSIPVLPLATTDQIK